MATVRVPLPPTPTNQLPNRPKEKSPILVVRPDSRLTAQSRRSRREPGGWERNTTESIRAAGSLQPVSYRQILVRYPTISA